MIVAYSGKSTSFFKTNPNNFGFAQVSLGYSQLLFTVFPIRRRIGQKKDEADRQNEARDRQNNDLQKRLFRFLLDGNRLFLDEVVHGTEAEQRHTVSNIWTHTTIT